MGKGDVPYSPLMEYFSSETMSSVMIGSLSQEDIWLLESEWRPSWMWWAKPSSSSSSEMVRHTATVVVWCDLNLRRGGWEIMSCMKGTDQTQSRLNQVSWLQINYQTKSSVPVIFFNRMIIQTVIEQLKTSIIKLRTRSTLNNTDQSKHSNFRHFPVFEFQDCMLLLFDVLSFLHTVFLFYIFDLLETWTFPSDFSSGTLHISFEHFWQKFAFLSILKFLSPSWKS